MNHGTEESRSGLYFEDFLIGRVFETSERQISFKDITDFAELTGDYNPLHTDPEYCKDTPFGVPIAHGLLVFGVFTGLYHRLGIFSGTALAFLEIADWKFRKAVLADDRVRGRITITAKDRTSNPERGIVTRQCEILNQRDEVVQQGGTKVLVQCRTSG